MDNGSVPLFVLLCIGVSIVALAGTAALTAWSVARRRRP